MHVWVPLIVGTLFCLALDLWYGRNFYLRAPNSMAVRRARSAGIDPYDVPADSFFAGLITPVILYREYARGENGRVILGDDRLKRTGWKVAIAW